MNDDGLWSEDLGLDGPAVVLLHPGIYDSTVWGSVLPLLTGVRWVRYDARGFGRSPVARAPFSRLDDLVGVLDEHGLDRVHLVGNSMGGGTCLSLALEQPDRVASLTLLAPAIEGYPWPDDDPELESSYAEAAASGDRAAMVAMWERIWCASGVDEVLRGQLGASYDADQVQDDLEVEAPEQWSRIGSIAVPTTVVTGGRDLPSRVTGARDLAAAIPGAELVVLEDADHLPSLREPRMVAETIEATVAKALAQT